MVFNVFSYKNIHLKGSVTICILLGLISLPGVLFYSGSSFYYMLFDISWLMVLFSALYFQVGYFYCFCAMMLFLGFWPKFIACVTFGYSLLEPIGYWRFLPIMDQALYWDRVLIVSSCAAIGVLLTGLLSGFITKKIDNKVRYKESSIRNIPLWFLNNRKMAWYSVIALAILANVLNLITQSYMVGLLPRLILPYHLNLLILWSLLFVFPLCLAVFFGYEIDLSGRVNKKILFTSIMIILVTSIIALSRSIYLFWTVPYVIVFIKQESFQNIFFMCKKYRGILLFYVCCFISSLLIVMICRQIYYPPPEKMTPTQILSKGVEISKKLNELKSMVVGRWIGLEGVMATTAYPMASRTFFWQGLIEDPHVNNVGIYSTQVIHPDFKLTEGRMFSSLPGLIAVLNYSSSLWFVFFGTVFVLIFLVVAEKFSFITIKSHYFVSQQGCLMAYWLVSGLNIPRLLLINLCEFVSVTFLLIAINFIYNLFSKRNDNFNEMNSINMLT